MKDIQNKEDIKVWVDAFYQRAMLDPLLAPIFTEALDMNLWEKHVNRIYDFWNTILFKHPDYLGNPFSHHKDLPIHEEHFEKWLAILEEVLFENFKGEKTEEVLVRAKRMGEMFLLKLSAIRENPNHRSIL